MVRPAGLEPTAYRFGTCRSVHLSYGRMTGGLPVEDLNPVLRVQGSARYLLHHPGMWSI